MKSTYKQILLEIICTLFVILFVYAAMSKLLVYQDSRAQLEQSPLLTDVAGWLVWGIPISEIIIAVLLVIPKFRLLGLYASFSLMMLFTTYLIVMLNFANDIPCSCGGILRSLGWKEHIYFNLFFIVIAGIGIRMSSNQIKKQMVSSP